MEPKKIAQWIAGCVAILAALGGGWKAYGGISDGIAQEAARAGEKAAAEYMEPVQERLEDIDIKLQRDYIEKKWDQCMQYSYPDAEPEVRRICCDEERDWRWAVWEWENSDSDEPEPELEPCP
jgi:hypothetical protein